MYRQLGLIFLILLLGCESILEIRLDHEDPQIVVIGLFTKNEPWQVLVQRTVGVQEDLTQTPRIEDAVVTIEGSDGSMVELTHKGGGFYYADTSLPRVGIMYTLKVKAEGYRSVEANDQVPRLVRVQDVKHITDRERTEISLFDEPRIENYYAISFLDDNLYWSYFRVLNPELYDQMKRFSIQDPFSTYIDQPEVRHALIHDKPFDGRQFILSLSRSYDDHPTTYVRSISRSYYDYYLSKIVQENTRGANFSEPAPLRSNVFGGQGVFAGYNLHVEGDVHPEMIGELILGTYEEVYPDSRSDRIEFTLHPNHAVTGFMQYTKDSEVINVSLDGGYSITNNESYEYLLQLHHTQASFFRNTELSINDRNGVDDPEIKIYLSATADALDRNGNYVSFSRSFFKRDEGN